MTKNVDAIRRLGEAAEHATSLPRKVGNTEPWQRAAKVLHQAAEHGGPFGFMARINFCKAVFGEKPPPIGNPEGKKGHRWGKAEAGEGSVNNEHFCNIGEET